MRSRKKNVETERVHPRKTCQNLVTSSFKESSNRATVMRRRKPLIKSTCMITSIINLQTREKFNVLIRYCCCVQIPPALENFQEIGKICQQNNILQLVRFHLPHLWHDNELLKCKELWTTWHKIFHNLPTKWKHLFCLVVSPEVIAISIRERYQSWKFSLIWKESWKSNYRFTNQCT